MSPVVDLRRLRLNQGLSVAKAADEIGVSRETLTRAEEGKRVPQPRNAFKIASFYGYKVTEVWPIAEPEDVPA